MISNPGRFSTIGRVFKVLWVEPAGSVKSTMVSRPPPPTAVHSKFRRFVVIHKGDDSTLCCPLHTYQGRATLKPKLKSIDMHAAAYSHTGKPKLQPGEELLIAPFPIIVETDVPSAEIDPMSRINFSKIYTVEHNVGVCNVGRIEPTHIDRLLEVSLLKHPPIKGATEKKINKPPVPIRQGNNPK